ncbi:hypothetical protein EJ02DRAFT_332896 [Clathrospora elynae]|uniref:Uncharacterized protein n=1 Tax=Clathrospora elynae TaxID=706981 RepID=A0A6A5T5X6_9PLEO|nr:hypothetical protein EJ02DRAFT_332896 [Clathrospora elynae]
MTSSQISDAFLELLQAVSPYVNYPVPSLHRFLDLPLELRHMIYEHYFYENRESLTYNGWPHTALEHVSSRVEVETLPFLPNLCLINRTTGSEVTFFLMGASAFEVENMEIAQRLMAHASQFNTFNLLDNLRTLRVPLANAAASESICLWKGEVEEKNASVGLQM